ncbi:MAG TPA: hypothetical protein VGN57_04320 [Pirellulaceae bacterium]|jgi:ribonuclease HII|nr:hypothetical protein [Pirellulaceae bacterium]
MSDEGTETYVIGTDEAGYGPNLGPLTIAATVWKIDGPLKPRTKDDPFRRFARKATDAPDDRPLIDDSKAIYGRGGLGALERATLAMLSPVARSQPVSPATPVLAGLAPSPAESFVPVGLAGLSSPDQESFGTSVAVAEAPGLSLREFWRSIVCHGDAGAWEELFWLREFADALPLAPPEDRDEDSDATGVGKKRRRKPVAPAVTFQFARAAAVFPESFNRGVAEAGNKASLLTRTTLALVAEIVAELPTGACVFWSADRHGGRKWYRDPLQEAFPDSLVMTVDESPTLSRYRWFRDGAPVECEFRVEGDSYVPTALASMSAKYLRELCMAAWNAHWLARRPDLRPTAGYPGDARRFFEEIRDLLLDAGVCERTVWRGC